MLRRLPPWRRLLLEYAAIFVIVFGGALLFSWFIGLIAGVVAAIVLRMTRPKPGDEPPRR